MDKKTKKFMKTNEVINFPYEKFDINRMFYSEHIDNPSNVYELYSVCKHYGLPESGHYTADCKNQESWYNYNDTSVVSLPSKDKINEGIAYILFYRKK